MSAPPETRYWLEGIRLAIEATGVPCGIGVKPETNPGQPWVILSTLSTTFDGDISVIDDEQNALVFVRSVGVSAEQAQMAYWRADAAVVGFETFTGGRVVYRTRDSITTPVRDDATFPDRSVYYADATYRMWLAPTGGQQ